MFFNPNPDVFKVGGGHLKQFQQALRLKISKYYISYQKEITYNNLNV